MQFLKLSMSSKDRGLASRHSATSPEQASGAGTRPRPRPAEPSNVGLGFATRVQIWTAKNGGSVNNPRCPAHRLSFVVVGCRWLHTATMEAKEAPISNLLAVVDLEWSKVDQKHKNWPWKQRMMEGLRWCGSGGLGCKWAIRIESGE